MNHSRIYRRFAAAAIAVLVLGLMPSVALAAGPVTHFTVTGPAVVNSGTSHVFTVTALDESDGVVTGYAGPADIVCTDLDAGVVNCPLSLSAFTNGVATISGLPDGVSEVASLSARAARWHHGCGRHDRQRWKRGRRRGPQGRGRRCRPTN